ncbi:MAG TPA: acyl-ACP--UDP-N-acetylglucosamine O-acyltransferase [Gammaproteobacteria bacterium]|nr:acyl-ACP--UDP-N-acetylglucosamine O-acyltransferase [Gammaproteobacteria bacterium]
MIDSHAVIDSTAKLADNVSVGPFSVIGPDVEIGAGSIIGPHVVLRGPTRIGCNNHIYQFASVGDDPQDKKYAGEPTRLEIGDNNTIREFCTINRGTAQDAGVTRIGDDNWIMAYVHIAHDCQIGSDIILANCTTLAGHVHIDDHAILGGFSKVHQFCKVGAHSFCGMDTGLNRDLPPYTVATGMPARPAGINSEGLKRRGFTPAQLRNIKNAYKLLYRNGLKLDEAHEQISQLAESHEELRLFTDFLAASNRSIVR